MTLPILSQADGSLTAAEAEAVQELFKDVSITDSAIKCFTDASPPRNWQPALLHWLTNQVVRLLVVTMCLQTHPDSNLVIEHNLSCTEACISNLRCYWLLMQTEQSQQTRTHAVRCCTAAHPQMQSSRTTRTWSRNAHLVFVCVKGVQALCTAHIPKFQEPISTT